MGGACVTHQIQNPGNAVEVGILNRRMGGACVTHQIKNSGNANDDGLRFASPILHMISQIKRSGKWKLKLSEL
jgi:hypothetical protein